LKMNIEKSLEMIKALADNSRLRILRALMEKPCYVEELSARLNLGAPTISFHLKKLEQAEFVCKNKEQYYVVYRLNDETLNLNLRDLLLFEDTEGNAQDERLQQYKFKVIKTYFQHGRLLRLPSQEKKRKIVLEEFAARFDPARNYTEQEINDIITELYEDYCTVRREMIDRHMMKRENGKYWLLKSVEINTNEFKQPVIKLEKKKMDRKAELKHEYKMNPRQGGVYLIRNNSNNKIFVGSGPNVEGQINKQKLNLTLNGMPVKELQQDWNKLGESGFTFEVLDRLKLKDDMTMKEYKEELVLLEQMWVEKLKSYGENGYNEKPAEKENAEIKK